jgi:ATP-binding cassette subfamily B protein
MLNRFVCVRQVDERDCGAAALATVALSHGLSLSLAKLRELTQTGRSGTSLLGLAEAADALGFTARPAKASWNLLRELPLPAIAHLTTAEGAGHYVVLHRVRRSSVVVGDPAVGVTRESQQEFCQRWTGFLLLLAPDAARLERGLQHERPTRPWGRFLALLRPHTGVLAEAFLCAVLMTALALSTSFFIQHLIDTVLVQNEWRLLNALAIGMLCVVVFRAAFGILRRYLLADVARRVDLRLISDYSRQIARLPLRVLEMRRVGELLARMSDAVKVRDAVWGATMTALVDATLVSISAVVMFLYEPRLAWIMAALALAFCLASAAWHSAIRRRSRETMERSAALQAQLAETVSSVETVKAFGLERARSDSSDESLARVVGSFFALQKLGLGLEALATLVVGGAGIVVLWYGGYLAMEGALTLGELMFFYSLVGMTMDPLLRLTAVNLQIQDALVAVERLYQILDLEVEQTHSAAGLHFEGVKQGIELRGVSFRYVSQQEVLSEINLTIPAGSTVAIVGESGSGKSTLLKLFSRLYDPTGGRISIDGTDLRDFELHSLRARVGYVSQHPFLFAASIADNLRAGKPDASPAEVLEAARSAGLEDFIAALPGRYEAMVEEGGRNLSGGQRQRLAIARALLLDPALLIFDEATSHLDTATELALQQNLDTLLAGRTAILVAHRLSTIRLADRIHVLHAGRIVESGTHAELVELGGRYAALWRAQSAGAPHERRPRLHIAPQEGTA